MGVKSVNQMEPPSLESMGSLEGKYQNDQENQIGQGSQSGHGRSMSGGQQAGGFSSEFGGGGGVGGNGGTVKAEKDCNKPNQGWRAAEIPPETYNSPAMRSLYGKPCAKGGKGRALEEPVTPDIRMVERKKEESQMQEVSRMEMGPQQAQAVEKDLKPNIKEKIETYTETYLVTSLATRVITRKRIFMQKRKIINQKINKPIVVIRRKIIKERQIFERIIPKIIETREIINNPVVKSKVVEGPIYEVSPQGPPPPQGRGQMRNLDDDSGEDCPEVEFDPNAGDSMGMNSGQPQQQPNYGSNMGGYQGYNNNHGNGY